MLVVMMMIPTCSMQRLLLYNAGMGYCNYILILYNTRSVIDITIHHQHNPGNCSAFLVLVNFIQRTFKICCLIVDAIYLMTVVTIAGFSVAGIMSGRPGRGDGQWLVYLNFFCSMLQPCSSSNGYNQKI